MYLGNQPALSYTSFAKQDFTTSATTSYVLNYPVTNENEIALFINFVRQEPTTAYTASGTSLTLTSATSASDDMYAIFLGKAVQTVNPPAGSVGTSQLADGAVTSAKMFSGFANGITMADQWRLTADTNTGTDADVTTNWERVDSTGWSGIGTGLTESSGIFSFPQTGIYLINFTADFLSDVDGRIIMQLALTTDNSTYTDVADAEAGNRGTSTIYTMSSNQFIFYVTNITTHKFKFTTSSFAGSTTLVGNTTLNKTFFSVIRLGDT